MGLEPGGTSAAMKGQIRRDTAPGMCTSQAREQGLHQQALKASPSELWCLCKQRVVQYSGHPRAVS